MNLIFDCIKDELTETIPNRYHSMLNHLRKYSDKENPTYQDLLNYRNYIHELIWVKNFTPIEIKNILGIDHSNFTMFVKSTLGIKSRSCQEANILHSDKNRKGTQSEKDIYRKKCDFRFDPYAYKDLPGYGLLLSNGMYHSVKNTNGVCRDHIISVEYGWRNNVDPLIISSKYNCQFLTYIENVKKSSRSDLTVEELNQKIKLDNFNLVITTKNLCPKTEGHKKKISESNKGFIIITNGVYNKRIFHTDLIPEGFRKGWIKNNWYAASDSNRN